MLFQHLAPGKGKNTPEETLGLSTHSGFLGCGFLDSNVWKGNEIHHACDVRYSLAKGKKILQISAL